MSITTKKVNQLDSVGTIASGDVLVGERVNGTTVRMTFTGIPLIDGDKGDVTVSSSGTVWTIDNDAVTYAKMQNVSATDKLLGRSTSGAGDVEEIACTAAGRALLDDATASDQRTTLGLGTLATQNGTFSGTSSGTNTGDQTSIVGITGTKAQFDTAVTDGNIVYTDSLGTNVATFLATPSSANLAAALTDETGAGAVVFGTSPTLATPKIDTISDVNGNSCIVLPAAASAVNHMTMRNAGTGSGVSLSATGSDSNINFTLGSKGTGVFQLNAFSNSNQITYLTNTGADHESVFNFPTGAATRTYTWPNASGTVLVTGTSINSVPSITFSSTSGIIGTTTNDNAAAGSVGEVISSSVTAVSINTATLTNITSISLTAGDWQIWGNLGTTTAVGTVVTQLLGWASLTSASFPTEPNGGSYLTIYNTGAAANQDLRGSIGNIRVSTGSTVTLYLTAYTVFTISTMTMTGFLGARRIR